jgi:hypothetical protein
VGAGTDENRQVVVLGDPVTNTGVANVDATFGLEVQVAGQQASATAGTITTSTSTVAASATSYGNASITISGTYAGVAIVFEASDNSGTTYFPIQAQRESDGQVVAADVLASNASVMYCVDLPGTTNVRVRATAYTSGTANVRITPGGMPFMPTVSVGNATYATGATPVRQATSTTAAQIVAANANRRSLVLFNEGAATALVLLGAGTPTSTSYSFQLSPGQAWEGINYLGRAAVITAAGSGNIMATEMTA